MRENRIGLPHVPSAWMLIRMVMSLMKFRMRSVFLAAALSGALLLQGCVYYNTFYNAKRYFREGIKENENNDTGRPKTTNYQKAIDSAARVLEYYPKSKYVDDALLIMGKAYYEIHTYPKARRKFEELLANCPDSPLKGEARLWLGRTMIAQGQEDQGIAVLTELWGENASEEIRLGSQRRLADYHFEKENYRQALLEYEKILEASKDKRERADVWYLAGECHYKLEEYEKAEEAYLKVLDEKPTRKREFDATFKRAVMMRLRGETEAALKICDNLLKKEIYFSYYDQVYLTKAEILSQLGRSEEAEALFQRILELYPRTDVSAQASYQLGKIYLEEVGDLAKAEEFLARVQTEKSGSEYALQAQELVGDLRFLKSLNSQIDSLKVEVDTLNYRLAWLTEHPGEEFPATSPEEPPSGADTLGLSGVPSSLDSLRQSGRPEQIPRQPYEPGEGQYPSRPPGMEGELPSELRGRPDLPGMPGISGMPGAAPQGLPVSRRMAVLPRDSVGIAERLQANDEELAELRFRLAEHIWRQFGDADSARIIFTDLSADSLHDDAAARSLLALHALIKGTSPDSTAPDSILQAVHDRYPGTVYDRWVRRILGLEPLPEPLDSAADMFKYAEDLWTDKNEPASAVREYRKVAQLYPESDWGAKSLYAAAWVQENVLKDIRGALASYDSIMTRYPSSMYYAIAQRKTAPPPPEEPDTTAVPPDTTLIASGEEIGAVAPTGSGQPQLIGGEAGLEDYIHKNHLYPPVAMEANFAGEALISFTVDVSGQAKDFNILQENPEGFDFGTMAEQALQAMRFKPAYAEGRYVESPMTQMVRFNP